MKSVYCAVRTGSLNIIQVILGVRSVSTTLFKQRCFAVGTPAAFDNEHWNILVSKYTLKYEMNSYALGGDLKNLTIEDNPIPVPAGSKAWICHRLIAGIAGSNPAEGMGVRMLWVLCVVS